MAIAGAVTVIAKYPSIIAVAVAFCIPVARVRTSSMVSQTVLAASGASLIVVGYMLLTFGFVVPRNAMIAALDEINLLPRSVLAFQAIYALALPLVLALAGARLLWRDQALLCGLLISGGLAWAVLHVALERYVSIVKDSAYGFFFLYPLAGVGFHGLWSTRQSRIPGLTATLFGWGVCQGYCQDRTWHDIRPAVDFILPQLSPNDRIAAHPAWDLAMYAVIEGPLHSPTQILDRYRVNRGADPCGADWILGTKRGPFDSGDSLVGMAEACSFDYVGSFPAPFLVIMPPLVRPISWDLVLFRKKGYSK